MNSFRLLKANEIECRVSTITTSGCSLLLYKDARVDQRLLDETVGAMNWQRHHSRDNANCVVSIWDEDKKQWIEKEDTGTESNTEATKGLASDSFKRACFNWGIGRELYSAPFIWVTDCKIEDKNGKPTTKDRFYVREIGYDSERNISKLIICNSKSNSVVFSIGTDGFPDNSKMIDDCKKHYKGENLKKLLEYYKVNDFAELTDVQLKAAWGRFNDR